MLTPTTALNLSRAVVGLRSPMHMSLSLQKRVDFFIVGCGPLLTE